jgi:hypothetical protein
MMKARIYDTKFDSTIQDENQLQRIIAEAASEVRQRKLLALVFLIADNGNELGIVVGGEETVLSFTYGSLEPPYYGSKGLNDSLEPVMTCFVNFDHHTEFARQYVIPFGNGLEAVDEFFMTGVLPECVEWMEV